jgi:hypothetical protein
MENSMEAPQKTKSRMKTTFTKTKMKQFWKRTNLESL